MKKFPLFFILLAISSIYVNAQNSITLSAHQDFKLLAFGDDLGNKAGTLNFLVRAKHELKENNLGYVIYGLEIENARLKDQYTRLGAFAGFTFMDVFDNYNLHATPSIGAGYINRQNKNLFSWSAALQLDYFISDTVRLSVLNQLTQRTDLEYIYDDLTYRYSFFVGIEVKIFDLKKKKN
mgnify:FL=1|tara:strand:- start:18111 stop:18650 length:540 start_codon:yes stop_codon:yes gene_type:complete